MCIKIEPLLFSIRYIGGKKCAKIRRHLTNNLSLPYFTVRVHSRLVRLKAIKQRMSDKDSWDPYHGHQGK